jgi:hypothetical protein
MSQRPFELILCSECKGATNNPDCLLCDGRGSVPSGGTLKERLENLDYREQFSSPLVHAAVTQMRMGHFTAEEAAVCLIETLYFQNRRMLKTLTKAIMNQPSSVLILERAKGWKPGEDS